MIGQTCRSCNATALRSFCDLGMSPLSNGFLTPAQLDEMEMFYPLHAYVCKACFLVQLSEFRSPGEIFSGDYAYYSSYSASWLRHAQDYAETMIHRFDLGAQTLVLEVASNDGYLLQYFRDRGIGVLGIEPAANVAKVAIDARVPTRVEFFSSGLAAALVREGKHADLLVGNNVLAHVPDLNDFVRGMKTVLAPDGVITMEYPHLLRLIEANQFDTIYHEHFSYFSLLSAEQVFLRHGLVVFDVEELSTHGGSLRIYARHSEDSSKPVQDSVTRLKDSEVSFGLRDLDTYAAFEDRVREAKRKLLEFLIGAKRAGKTIVGYGAPAKGNTLLNYCGIRGDFVDFTVDRNPHKQGRFLPGTHIPILSPNRVREARPDYLLVLPWNLRDEIVEQMFFIREWGGSFILPIPEVEIVT